MNACNVNREQTGGGAAATERAVFAPAYDLMRDASGWTIVLDVPGATRETIDLEVTPERGATVLTINARVPSRGAPEGGAMLVQEYRVGDYRAAFRLPADADAERIEASYDAGVLNVRLPVSAKAGPRKIALSRD